MEEVYSKFISAGQKQPQLRNWKRFIPSILAGHRISCGWDLGEIYSKFLSGGQKQPQLRIWKKFIPSLLVGDRSS